MSKVAHDPADYRTPDAYPLQIGAGVFDIKQLCEEEVEPERAIVIDTHADTVHDVTFENRKGDEVTLAGYEPNITYADFSVSSRVVTIAWESWLDNNTPGWAAHRDDPTALADYLSYCEASWDIPVSTVGSYDYPESRLRHVDTPASLRER